jgi:hypothetical protein
MKLTKQEKESLREVAKSFANDIYADRAAKAKGTRIRNKEVATRCFLSGFWYAVKMMETQRSALLDDSDD